LFPQIRFVLLELRRLPAWLLRSGPAISPAPRPGFRELKSVPKTTIGNDGPPVGQKIVEIHGLIVQDA